MGGNISRPYLYYYTTKTLTFARNSTSLVQVCTPPLMVLIPTVVGSLRPVGAGILLFEPFAFHEQSGKTKL